MASRQVHQQLTRSNRAENSKTVPDTSENSNATLNTDACPNCREPVARHSSAPLQVVLNLTCRGFQIIAHALTAL